MSDPKGPWIQEALDRYERPLVRYASRILGDVERGRDVVQEAFLKLCKQDPAELNGHLTPWLYAVCRNRAFDILRKEQRMNPLTEARQAVMASPRPGPDHAVQEREESERIESAIADLPENQQEVIRLKFQHGLSYREIARVTELTVSNVGFLIHTGIKALRGQLVQG